MGLFQRLGTATAQFLLIPVIGTIATAAYAAPSDPSGLVTVTAVIDGDTIDVVPGGRIRLLGIDAPEIGGRFEHPAPFAREARDRLAGLVLRRVVRLEFDVERRDDYGRGLAYLLTERNGGSINALLVREGLARVSARRRLKRLDELQSAENESRLFRRGLWGPPPLSTTDERYVVRVPPAAQAGKTVRCEATTTRGTRCRRRAVLGERYCALHIKAAGAVP